MPRFRRSTAIIPSDPLAPLKLAPNSIPNEMPGWKKQGQLGHNSHFSWVSQVLFLAGAVGSTRPWLLRREETGEQRSAKSSSFPESWNPWKGFLHPSFQRRGHSNPSSH